MEHVIWISQRSQIIAESDFTAQYEPENRLNRAWANGKTKYKAISALLRTIPNCFKDDDILIIKHHEERKQVKEFLK